MMLKDKEIMLRGTEGKIFIERNEHGIPEIKADNLTGLAYGLGWVHASDRQLQALMLRILVQGRASEVLSGTEELIEVDRFMRRMNFFPDPDREIARLRPDVKGYLQAYADGFNFYLKTNKLVFEFSLLGYKPEPWEIKDSIIIAKVMGFLGLADAQGNMEKLLVQMIQNDIDEKRIRELFPYLKEKINYDLIKKIKLQPPPVPDTMKWLDKIPKFIASNNWVVSGSLTESGKPILCNDPHLEVNRLPSIWQETVMRLPDDTFAGISIPGVFGVVFGRSKRLSWGATFAFMDMVDYRIEQCRDGKYKRGNLWKPFKVREEKINVKKGEPVIEMVYENEHGILEGDPNIEGYYLVMDWSAAEKCGAETFNAFIKTMSLKSAKEAMRVLSTIDAIALNWLIADIEGNFGYQMSGRVFNRPKNVTGLLPMPGWEKKYDYKGYADKTGLPSLYNPKDGIIATANQDLNHLGKIKPINLAMSSYRADRITQLLKKKKKMNVEYMKGMHFDLYSLQAEKFMKVLKPLLPDTKNGIILKDWDCMYTEDSRGATLFESVYLSLLRTVFGDCGMGRDAVNYLMDETGIFNDYIGYFDDILLKRKSAWYGSNKREDILSRAIEEGLKARAVPYGKTRKVVMSHLLFGGMLPRFFGFDYGPISLPGSRATIPQGQIFKSAGRTTTFSPSYRMIIDMATDEMHTNIAGGATDRRFSKWYLSDIKNWLSGVYKVLK